MPNVEGTLDFSNKPHKVFYHQGCKRYYEEYDVNTYRWHAIITASTFKVKKLGWAGDTCDILEQGLQSLTN